MRRYRKLPQNRYGKGEPRFLTKLKAKRRGIKNARGRRPNKLGAGCLIAVLIFVLTVLISLAIT